MSVMQTSSTHMPEGLPGPDSLTWMAAEGGQVLVYQPYIGAAQKALVHKEAIAFDVSFNSAPDTREYELFRALHAHHRAAGLEPDVFWGLLSTKYELKAATSFPAFLDNARNARAQGADCYLYNPMIGCASIYGNVQEHASLGGHPGMEAVFQYLGGIGYPVADPQGTDTFFFCNYFCGNERFWSGYFRFCEEALDKLEHQARIGAPAGLAYRGSGHYSRDGSAKMRPFVIERLAGYYIKHAVANGLKVVAHRPGRADFEWKFGRRLGDLLHQLYEMKQTAIDNRDAAVARAWSDARLPLVRAPQPVWQMDDPPDWMPRSTRSGTETPADGGVAATAEAQPRAPVGPAPSPEASQPPGEGGAHGQRRAFPGGWKAHRNRHCIWIVSPRDYPHCHAFDEVALALSGAFEELGGSAPVVTSMQQFRGRVPIIYGGNLLPAEIIPQLPKESIIVNLEQVSQDSAWFRSAYRTILKTFPVLDYSPRNRDNLARLGIPHAEVLEIGFQRRLRQIRLEEERDIDVLFYGSLNAHRKTVLNAMHQAGLKVMHLFGVYGQERDKMIARSKVVLNLHQFRSQVFEVVRVSYLLANSVCVLSEGEPSDPDIQPFLGGLAVAPQEALVERCRELVADAGARDAIAAAGFDIMRRRSQADMLKAVMAPY